MADLADLVGEEKLFRTIGEYRVGISAAVLAPCFAGVFVGVCERFGVSPPVQPDAVAYGTISAAVGVMGYLFARRAHALAHDRGLDRAAGGVAALLSGAAGGAAYGAFAWIAQQVGYWDVRISTMTF